MATMKDLTGERFGRLTVVELSDVKLYGKHYWLCECDCGNTTVVRGSSLVCGDTRSCGCLASELAAKRLFKHGLRRSRLNDEWRNMKQRCYNPNHIGYVYYGARGIQVCDEWRNDFQAFYDDVSKLPHFKEPNYTLDRIETDGDYEPGNVRWADKTTQQNNRRCNIRITYNGETHTLIEWSRKLGIEYHKLRWRLNHGWDIERAFTTY